MGHPAAQPFAGPFEPQVDLPPLTENGSYEDAAQHDDDILGLRSKLNTHYQRHQTQAVQDGLTHPLGQALPQPCAQDTSQQYSDDVYQSADQSHSPHARLCYNKGEFP